MKLVELECQNCGAALKVEEGSDTIHCPYCKATYKLDDEAQHVKYDDMENSGYEFEKGRIKAQKEHAASNSNVNVVQKFSMVAIIPFIIIPIIVFVIIISSAVGFSKWKSNSNNDSSNNVSEEAEKKREELAKKEEEERQQRELESKVHDFNWKYSSGKKAKIFVESDLNNVINTNRTNRERFITVKFNNIETHNSEEILGIINQLERNKDYDVLLDYDEDGFITVMTIK